MSTNHNVNEGVDMAVSLVHSDFLSNGVRIEWGTAPDTESVTWWFDTEDNAQRLATVFNEACCIAWNIGRAVRAGI